MARSIFNRVRRSLKRRVRYNLYPRAIVWKYRQKQCPTKPFIIRLDKDLKVRVYPHDVIGKHIYIDGVFEPEVFRFVKSYLKPGMIVFDLGSNLGQYTLLAARCVGEKGRVHSFEPSSSMFAELEFNVSLNNLSDTCILNKAAVSDVSGTAKLSKYEPGAEVYNSLGSHTRKERARVGYEDVKTIRLDDYVKEMGCGQIDFMKIDIEGAELLALRGAENILLRSDAPVILLELADVNTAGFGYAAVEIWDYLKSLGYRVYSLDRRSCGPEIVERPDKYSPSQNLVAIKAISE